jgi:hypothetical protein
VDVRITLVGTRPLLMHNVRLANPLDPISKAIKAVSSKRKKTDDDYEEMARLEHAGGLYYDEEIGPYLPGQYVYSCLREAARITKAGRQIERALIIETEVNPIAYRGPRSPEAMWADQNFRHFASVRIGQQRVMRSRPQFRDWQTSVDIRLDTNMLNLEELREIAERAGLMVGVGDYRPTYGRFMATVEEL